MTKNIRKHTQCNDCKGLGYIKTSQKNYTQCIICNATGSTTKEVNGTSTEAQQVLLYKIALDFINGKEKGWYH